jgi:anthranilate synthase component 1
MSKPALKDRLRAVAGTHAVVASSRSYSMDCDTPLAVFARVGAVLGAPTFLLESVEGGEVWARYSLMGFGALVEVVGTDSGVEVRYSDGTTRRLAPGLTSVRALLSELAPDAEARAALPGGLFGYVAYDAVRDFEAIPESHPDPAAPRFRLLLPEVLFVFDSFRQELRAVVYTSGHGVGRDGEALDAVVAALEERQRLVERLLCSAGTGDLARCGVLGAEEAAGEGVEVTSNFAPGAYCEAVEQVKEYIRAGDIFQAVLSQRFTVRGVGLAPLQVYRRLRRQNPSPYHFYLHWPDETLIGASPEVMARLTRGVAEVRPIAGTRPRGETAERDLALERELLADPKEVAEHVMLLDLGRNDLGRVCEIGSVEIPERMVIERYSRVMHMVSHVRARLTPERDWLDLFAATFPAGTLSGAPKIRAMEIIDELEPTRRDQYGGAVGYVGFDGRMDMCIAIRTLRYRDGVYTVQVGAGIVADSVPEREQEETVNKARAMLRAIGVEPPPDASSAASLPAASEH